MEGVFHSLPADAVAHKEREKITCDALSLCSHLDELRALRRGEDRGDDQQRQQEREV